MNDSFGPASTADEVLASMDLRGRRVLVTGVSAGLGVETARALVARGAHVVGTARDLAKAKAVTKLSGRDRWQILRGLSCRRGGSA